MNCSVLYSTLVVIHVIMKKKNLWFAAKSEPLRLIVFYYYDSNRLWSVEIVDMKGFIALFMTHMKCGHSEAWWWWRFVDDG